MSERPPLARAYDALLPKILQRLLEMRANLDPSLGRVDDSRLALEAGKRGRYQARRERARSPEPLFTLDHQYFQSQIARGECGNESGCR